jgi:hypothetical protein
MPAMRQKVVTGLLLMVEDRQREKKKYEKDDGFGFLVGAVWTPHEDLFEYFIQTNIHTDIQTEGRQRTDKDREHPSVRHPELSHHSHHSQHAGMQQPIPLFQIHRAHLFGGAFCARRQAAFPSLFRCRNLLERTW